MIEIVFFIKHIHVLKFKHNIIDGTNLRSVYDNIKFCIKCGNGFGQRQLRSLNLNN